MNLRIFLSIPFVIALIQHSAVSQGRVSDPSIESLRGLKAITLVVDRVQTVSLPVNAKPNTPTPEEVKAEAEFWLKKLGINLVSSTENQKLPSLHLTLLAEKDNNGGNHFNFAVRLVQEVSLLRDPSLKIQAPTWNGTLLGYTSGYKPFEGLVCQAIVPFVTAYNSVNAPEKITYVGDESSVCLQR